MRSSIANKVTPSKASGNDPSSSRPSVEETTQLKARLRVARSARSGADLLNAALWRKCSALQARLTEAEAARQAAEQKLAQAGQARRRLQVSATTDQDVHAEVCLFFEPKTWVCILFLRFS